MPFIGLGLHALVALFFAVHAVRSRQEMYWLFILFAFPLLGSVVYFVAVFLPSTRLPGDLKRASSAAGKAMNPGKELREASREFDLTPNTQNRMRLARALSAAGRVEEAAEHFEATLSGPFASDPEILLGAAEARLAVGRGGAARELLHTLKEEHPNYRAEQVLLMSARSFAEDGKAREAEALFRQAVNRYDSVDSRAEYAIWALRHGELQTAAHLCGEIDHASKYWSKHSKRMYRPLMKRLDQALAGAREG